MTLLDEYQALPGEPSRVPYGNGTLALRTTIAALRRKVDRREAIIRLLCRALREYGGHLDGCDGPAGYLDPRCTCGLAALLTAVERDFPEGV